MAHALAKEESGVGPASADPTPADPTIAFYDREAERYFEATLSNDLAALRSTFLARVPAGGLILDAGSGSGRDMLAFIKDGFRVEAFDASSRLAARAAKLTGVRVAVERFEDWTAPRERYDGVWCFASLLHVARADLPSVVSNLVTWLKPGGCLFASFKHGTADSVDDLGRRYTNMTPVAARNLFAGVQGLSVSQVWEEAGPASLGGETIWVYALCERTS